MYNNENDQDLFKEILTLGEINPKKLITVLFFAGVAAIIYWSIKFGTFISIANTYVKTVKTPGGMYTGMAANNTFLGFLTGIVCFIFLFVVWKVFCELLLLIFHALRSYIAKRNPDYIGD